MLLRASSAVYLVNDVADREADRRHPRKRLRPIASGLVSPGSRSRPRAGLAVAAVLAPSASTASFGVLVVAYLVLQAAYALGLKHEPVLDIAIVASGFLMRAVAGGIATDIPLSQWFLMVAGFGSLFIVAGKRYSELLTLGSDSRHAAVAGRLHRHLPAVRLEHRGRRHDHRLLPVGLLAAARRAAPGRRSRSSRSCSGMLRYAVDVDAGNAGEPEDIVVRDRVLQLIGVAWLVCVGLGVSMADDACSPAGAAPRPTAPPYHTVDATDRRVGRSRQPDRGPDRPRPRPVVRRRGAERRRPRRRVPHTIDEVLLDRDTGSVTRLGRHQPRRPDAAAAAARLFVPVTPGTRYVTVGGAIAADIHGKNHHVDGTFGSHVAGSSSSTAREPCAASARTSTPAEFWATVGGMGLTGVITRAASRCARSSRPGCESTPSAPTNLDRLLELMAAGDDDYTYSVAWIDLLAAGTRTRPVGADPRRARDLRRAAATGCATMRWRSPRGSGLARPSALPGGLGQPADGPRLQRAVVPQGPATATWPDHVDRELLPPARRGRAGTGSTGRGGLVQYQFVVPSGPRTSLREAVARISRAGQPSFLAVLKRFGAANPALLSFPMPGWTLALDLPGRRAAGAPARRARPAGGRSRRPGLPGQGLRAPPADLRRCTAPRSSARSADASTRTASSASDLARRLFRHLRKDPR